MRKYIRNTICIITTCIIFLCGCSNSKEKQENGNKEGRISISKEEDTLTSDKIDYSSVQGKGDHKDSEINESSEIDNLGNIENITYESNEQREADLNEGIDTKGIAIKVKDYILSSQDDKPEALRLKWSEVFLNSVNIEELAEQYLSKGGSLDNIEDFVEYITLNAPIISNWEELFKKDLYDKYGEEVTKIELLDDDLYQAYVNMDGSEIPYVVVSARTGYFHG